MTTLSPWDGIFLMDRLVRFISLGGPNETFIKRFSIIGGGGFGHEVISYIRELYYDMNLEIRV